MTLKDKIAGCWAGKNIGGILGGPFEALRQINNVTFYTQDLSEGLPGNDDLDLQLVWLNAVEKYGKNVDAHILAEYWLSYIVPDWVEYGTAKTNLKAGLMAPICGHVANKYENSCGAFIRSELWACLFAGHPEMAVRYAYEDAIVDHSDEGLYAEIFMAALQSAAFVVSDKNKLIQIGLSYIPNECAVAKAIKLVLECHKNNVDPMEVRTRIMKEFPGNFGIQHTKLKELDKSIPYGEPGFDAPCNVGFVILGWMYGDDDFGKSLCMAVNCGEDTDCTAASLGAILGIIHGYSGLPEKWLAPLGDQINTKCINRTTQGVNVPETVPQLTDRIISAIPQMLEFKYFNILSDGLTIETKNEAEMSCCREDEFLPLICGGTKSKFLRIDRLLKLSPNTVKYELPTVTALLTYENEPFISKNVPYSLKLTLIDNGLTAHQQWADVKLYLPDGVTCLGESVMSAPVQNTYLAKTEFEFVLNAEELNTSKIECLIDISIRDRHSGGIIKATFFAGKYRFDYQK